MKTLFSLLIAVILSGSISAQLTKGRVSYDITVTSDDPQTSAFVDQMQGSTLELYFMDDKVRSEMYMGEFMTMVNIMQKGQDSTLTLMDGMMGKIAMKTTENDLDEEQKLAISKRRVDLVEGTKEIMGYTCKKAIVTNADNEESVVWYSTEIVPSHRKGQFLYDEIPGVPLQMETSWGKMKLTIVAFDFSKKVKKPEELFSLDIPKGYVFRTAQEMKKMRQGR